MGTQDKIWSKMKCNNCEITETISASDKGSGWGGSYWNGYGDSASFNIKTSGGGEETPEVIKAICKECGNEALIESKYCLSRPDDY